MSCLHRRGNATIDVNCTGIWISTLYLAPEEAHRDHWQGKVVVELDVEINGQESFPVEVGEDAMALLSSLVLYGAGFPILRFGMKWRNEVSYSK